LLIEQLDKAVVVSINPRTLRLGSGGQVMVASARTASGLQS